MEEKDDYEPKLKLYSLLIEQFSKYQTVIWQIPAVLATGNFTAIAAFPKNPFLLFCLFIFNSGLIFVLFRMMKSQNVIIKSIKTANKELKKFKAFIPKFGEPSEIPARYVFRTILVLLNICLFVYVISLFCFQFFCTCNCHP